MASDNVSGSFFNQVPNDKSNDGNGNVNGNDESSNETNNSGDDASAALDPFEASMAELMRKRNKKPLASKPSTLGGVPTSKATGFGKQARGPQIVNKIQSTSNASGNKQSFIGIGKPLNDVNNPEYDDQGYTLYANEETGEKQRVFEALIEYPCEFKMKIIGANEGTFAKEMVQVVADSCNVESDVVKFSERTNGKWTSVTVFAPVESAEMLYSLYENIDRDPRVKFKF
eukprot:CAMPEP_0203658050 /NCGR_PEP_ID=MMETSP0088-20131115/47139_1 /ASSEMBLY_ACC=CAM_ASM_001087 /TAXON_ID=426623 /ORGANISM="Chaetoceros affinis, Strain CCMP159" /LENGTH=228 /DNA_ID=CAMNT_0050519615 /DNA_START=456 /DNA_END=1139 /DNA_ORIENTATION=-